MGFKVTARTLLQLGSELISSDAIAFYELIKNAFDANSPKVTVRVVSRIPFSDYQKALEQLKESEGDKDELKIIDNVKENLSKVINENSFNADAYKIRLKNASKKNIRFTIETANYILFEDAGDGMSLAELDNVYLTIGTRSRQKEKQSIILNKSGYANDRPILGEKGIGRLSVMRLGDGLKIETKKTADKKLNILEIDWSVFSHDSDALLETFSISPRETDIRDNAFICGTKIYIYKLPKQWTKVMLEGIANENLSKFFDPFQKNNWDFIKLWFNKEPVIIRRLNKLLFESAHALVDANFEIIDNRIVLSGAINLHIYNRKKNFSIEGPHLLTVLDKLEYINKYELLKKLGPFSLRFYWFNNRIVENDSIGTQREVRDLVKSWAGGLMVYRDGFRVYPYGGLDDDWLQLDPTALGEQGYKVNRRQIIGKVDISSLKNPSLIDQTNREGLRDCPEKQVLMILLQHVLWTEFKPFLQNTEKEVLTHNPIDLDEIEERLKHTQDKLSNSFKILTVKFPEIRTENKTFEAINEALNQGQTILNAIRLEKKSINQQRAVTLNLAGLGLMVDVIAHELTRSTEYALNTINSANKEELSTQSRYFFNTLSSQLETLKRRLKILDPLSPSSRQSKETFNLYDLVKETLDTHKSQFKRHQINFELEYTSKEWKIKAVKGMFIQILENLISNSVYWLKHKQVFEKDFVPNIRIFLDQKKLQLIFADNGPGIPFSKKDEVFLPFVTTKPPGDGKGLGLYISKEIAKYHNATLYLKADNFTDYLNTFVLDLNNIK